MNGLLPLPPFFFLACPGSSTNARICVHTKSSCEGTHGDLTAERQSIHACSFHSYWPTSEHKALNSTPPFVSVMEMTISEGQNHGSFAEWVVLGPNLSQNKNHTCIHPFRFSIVLGHRASWQVYTCPSKMRLKHRLKESLER